MAEFLLKWKLTFASFFAFFSSTFKVLIWLCSCLIMVASEMISFTLGLFVTFIARWAKLKTRWVSVGLANYL